MDLYVGRIEESEESEEASNAMVEQAQAVPGDGSGGAFIGIQVMPPHRRYSGAPPPSAIALMMTNSNNSWKAHRATEWSSISHPLRQREASREERQHGGPSFGKGEKLRRKSTQTSQV